MLQDRRQYQRVIPDHPLLVRWGESECRLVFDICEEGLAVDGFASESQAQVIPLMLDLPDDRGHIQAKGEIAWTNDSEKRTGLRFVDLADTSRQQLRQWVSASVFDATELALAEDEPARPPVSLTCQTDSVDPFASQPMADEELASYRGSHHLTWLVLAALSLFSGVAFVRHYFGGAGGSWQTKEIMAAGKVPETSSLPSSALAKQPPETTPPPLALPLNVPGFVLQVAAMKHEDNADALAKTLQKKNFPAFVFKRGANPFYRVAVGAYSDPDSAVRVKERLKEQGFDAILKHWSPA